MVRFVKECIKSKPIDKRGSVIKLDPKSPGINSKTGGTHMSLVRWDPFRDMATLQDRINRLFNDAFPRSAEAGENLNPSAWHPPVDIFETEEGVSILVDLPGVNKKDVSLEVKENILTIKGERKIDPSPVSEDRYYRKERIFGTFQRSFAMNTAITPDTIKATYKNGVLKIELPKPNEAKPRHVSVKIE